ncbi:HlyD family type I secretion periplasmic adaptor subunit [Bradyrhizobium sp. GCM10027634]|uniref:HlyD family type I secretion periplasmic adaptor subunit n=1 Tax=unclassified Bradyrhizobium TaxID=2631580 RepID=UPI00188C554A|nr:MULTISPECIES: HlyD family type I secretion periplasmic adaptor subunit [unclassified Bradyrhizobium]MDN5001033.1 HlyD family type I secretion periplasmic adaptor subunit [Bradyrhizobium sp. WYCCWR 12677]QOZ46507.1 HlyD family type I secretion periplasmic adaptor subunit [Bradyrhizobium sp. CCBAU 53340]
MSADFTYANDIRAAVKLKTPRTSRMLLWAFCALFATFLVWAHFAVLEEVKRGNGKVVPSRQMQVVQSLEGGIVGDILVQEGAVVQQGQSLMRIDDTKFASEFGEIRERRASMAARLARLEAEVNGRSEIVFPDQIEGVVPAAVTTERSVFKTRALKVAQDVDVLNQQIARLTQTSALLDRELTLTRKLYEQKVVPEIEMLRLERQSAEAKGQIAEAKAKIATTISTFRAQADEDLAKARADLAVLDENIKSAQDRVRRTDLRSPVRGIVNKLNVTTIGAVVQPGANLMDIVPLDDTLLVEGKIRPQDIAFIRPGQDAVVKISAYDSSVYGHLAGKVERISADTILDDKGESAQRPETYYRVMVRTDKNHLGTEESPLPIIPGMITTVEILTGKKSVLDYIMKPARTLRDEALREH